MTTPQDPYGRPNMPPAAPPLNEGELRGVQSLPAPTPVQVSFWLWVATAVVGLVGAALVFTQRDTALEAARAANVRNISDAQLQAAVTVGLVFAAVVAVVFAGLYLLFAFKARAGRNWARIVLTVLAVLDVLLLLFSRFSLLSGLSTLAAVVAAVLLFLPASNQFYAASKRPAVR